MAKKEQQHLQAIQLLKDKLGRNCDAAISLSLEVHRLATLFWQYWIFQLPGP